MNPTDPTFDPAYLKVEIDRWGHILQMWRDNLHFLSKRLSTITISDSNIHLLSKKEAWLRHIDYLADSVMADYQGSFVKHVQRMYNGEAADELWQEEHQLYRRHMRQLKGEFRKLVLPIYQALESK